MTSRILVMPVTNSIIRSNPSPNPACGTVPKRRVSRYHHISSTGICISFIRASSRSSLSSRCEPPTSLPNPGDKDIHGGDGLSVVVLAHIEGLDRLSDSR